MTSESIYHYALEPRETALGGGYRLRLFEGGQEVGGGVFPLGEFLDGEITTDDADKMAFSDAQAEGESWLSSR